MGQHFRAKIPAQVLGRAKVHPAAIKYPREFVRHFGEAEKAGNVLWIKLNEYVNITPRAEVTAQYRPEQRELAHVMPAAQRGNLGTILFNQWQHGSHYNRRRHVECVQYYQYWSVLAVLPVHSAFRLAGGACRLAPSSNA